MRKDWQGRGVSWSLQLQRFSSRPKVTPPHPLQWCRPFSTPWWRNIHQCSCTCARQVRHDFEEESGILKAYVPCQNNLAKVASAKNGNKVEAVKAHASIRPDRKGRSMGLTRRIARSHRLKSSALRRPREWIAFQRCSAHLYIGNHLEGGETHSSIRSSGPWWCGRGGGDIWEANIRIQNRSQYIPIKVLLDLERFFEHSKKPSKE